MNKLYKGFFAIVGAQLCWSTIEIVGSFAYKEGISPLTLLSVRFIVSSLLMFLAILIWKKKLFKVKIKDIKIIVILGLILLAHLLGFWKGIQTINHVPTAIGIYFTFPLWIILVSRLFLKEKITKIKSLCLGMGLIGSLLVIKVLPNLNLSSVNWIGVVLMFVASIGWALYTLVGKKAFKKYHPLTILFYNFVFIFLATLVLQSPVTTIQEINLKVFYYLLYMGAITTFLAYVLFYAGVKLLKPSTAGIIAFSKPFISIVLAFLFLSQVTNFYQVIGIILIISSTYLITKEGK